ncbi:hypothetical protein [Bacillus sp. J33]|uniref:hypothetical protein n=1 Tax=Bacillus sp. J33 TaxID=935836 RepID=UPI0004B0B243|nr:hypothetical protein [Bacillus sp. J33]
MLGKEDSDAIYKLFMDMLTRAYEKGIWDKDISVNQLLMEIENDLRKIMAN